MCDPLTNKFSIIVLTRTIVLNQQIPASSLFKKRLTAFVVKSFHQAKPHIFIDDEILQRAIDWMISRQNGDGSFPEPGRVVHKDMLQVSSSIS